MSDYKSAPEGKDPVLWEMAQRRASFKTHLISYIIVNAFFWAVWFLTSGRVDDYSFDHMLHGRWPWPVWPTLGWGIGLAFHFAGAYIFPRANSVENEYEKLKKQQQKNK